MELGQATDPVRLFNLPEESFSEDEVSTILGAVLDTIDTPFKKSQSVPKNILIDFFGTQKAGKTKTTEKIEQVFRRNKFNAFCPPETAEIEEVRNKLSDNAVIAQAIHLTGVQDYVLSLAQHPRFHLAVISRGLIDMLYWYEKGLRKGLYTETHVRMVRNQIYEFLKLDLVDAFFFFTCSVETAMRREYEEALTQKRGTKMNEQDVAETLDIYEHVIGEVNRIVPGLPICHIDTSELSVKQVGEETLKFLLPTICNRFNVPEYRFMAHSMSLIRKQADRSFYFEEQLKFLGHPSQKRLDKNGWNLVRECNQEDVYLADGNAEGVNSFGEDSRIRTDGSVIKFMYKTAHRDRMLSHRRPVSFNIDPEEARKILKSRKTITVLRKYRRHFQKNGPVGDDHFFTLHLDEIEGLGSYTEIRARGSLDKTHTRELLSLAADLGLNISSMVEGSYLSLILNNKK